MKNVELRIWSKDRIKKYVQSLLPLEVDIKEVHTGRALDYEKHRDKHGPHRVEMPTVYAHIAKDGFWCVECCDKWDKKHKRCRRWSGRCKKGDDMHSTDVLKPSCTGEKVGHYRKRWVSCKDKWNGRRYGCANHRHWHKIGGVDGNGDLYHWTKQDQVPSWKGYPKLHTDANGNFDWVTQGQPTTYTKKYWFHWYCHHKTVKVASNQSYNDWNISAKAYCKLHGHKHWIKIKDKTDIWDPRKHRDINKDKGPLVVKATVKLKIRVMFPRIFGNYTDPATGKRCLLLTNTCRMMKEDESW